MKNIVLIGMPSSGKTSIGLLLAKRCGYGFIDSDLLIQNDQKALLCDIIAREGAEGFIAIEERINAELWAQRCIIATGGSVVYGDRAMRHLKEIGKVVYLKLDAGEVCRRIKNFTRRAWSCAGTCIRLRNFTRSGRPSMKNMPTSPST